MDSDTPQPAPGVIDGPGLLGRRIDAGLTQQEVAERAGNGCTRQDISHYEAGHWTPRPRRLAAIAAVFGCKATELLKPVSNAA